MSFIFKDFALAYFRKILKNCFALPFGLQPRLITLASTLIIPDITRTEFNYCFIIHCFMENIQKLLCEMKVDFINYFVLLKIKRQAHQTAASLETIQVVALFSQRYIMHAV